MRGAHHLDTVEVSLRFGNETIKVILRILNSRLLYSINRALSALEILLAWLNLLLLLRNLLLIAHSHRAAQATPGH